MSEPKVTAFSFNARNVAPAKASTAVPSGWYLAIITDAEKKPIKGPGGGERINLTHQIIEQGEYNGSFFTDGLNVVHSNAKTRQIAEGQFSALCHAVGVVDVQDLRQLFNLPVMVKVKFVPERTEGSGESQKTYDAKNEISAYKAVAGAAGAAAAAAAPQGPPPGTFQQAAAPFQATAPPVQQFQPQPIPGVAPVAATAPPVVVAFPPAGWLVHPQSPTHYYEAANVANIKTEQELRAMFPAPAAVAPPVVTPAPVYTAPPVTAPVVTAPPVQQAPPVQVAPPVAQFPPHGWQAHPQSPGWFWNPTTGQTADEQQLRAIAAAPPVPQAGGYPAAGPAPVAGEEVAPWERPA